MLQTNVYKPRYKIAFQAKSKIWPYKNSRLRRFFNIRGRKLVRRGLFKRYFLVFNNMKWTIARRYVRPYMKKRRPMRRRYRNVFYTKQQLRAFYGKQKEEAFRNFFKKFLGGAKGRNNMFAIALERRADMFLFRLRFLPTVYACHQFIHHFGLDINGKKETSPSALIRPGDIVTFNKAQWVPFVEYLYERLYWRVYGLNIWKRRQFKSLRKKVWWCYKNKFFKKSNVFLLRKFNFVLKKLLRINNSYSHYLPTLYKEIRELEIRYNDNSVESQIFKELKNNLLSYWKEYRVKVSFLIKKLNRIYKKKWRLKLWSWRRYYAHYFILMTYIFRFYKLLKFYFAKFKVLELNFYKNLLVFNAKTNWKVDVMAYKSLKDIVSKDLEGKKTEISTLQIKESVLQKKENLLKKKVSFIQAKHRQFLNLGLNNFKYQIFAMKGKNHISNIFNQLNKKYQKKLAYIQKELNTVQSRTNSLNSEINLVKIQQINQFESLSNTIKDKMESKNDINILINKQIEVVEKRFDLFNEKLEVLLNFILKRRIKRYSLKSKVIVDPKTNNKIVRKSPILYFLTKRRMKKERKMAIPRLKRVHWYVPSYIYFDYRTLRAVFLYNPKPEEIVYSFKCSLRSLHSFYRSLGI